MTREDDEQRALALLVCERDELELERAQLARGFVTLALAHRDRARAARLRADAIRLD